MLCGRAALVTEIAGHLEWITDGATGFVAQAPSAPSLRRTLEQAWQAREKWGDMGCAAHEFASRKYDVKAGETLLEILKNAAKARGSETKS
jgi:glycosyltransferase involved in cell wall biosynthesis